MTTAPEIANGPDTIRTNESYMIPEFRGERHWKARSSLEFFPRLRDEPWCVDTYTREFHEDDQRHFFLSEQKEGYYPLVKGAQFNLFGVHQGNLPEFWLDPSEQEAGGFLRDKQERRILLAIGNWLDERRGVSGGKKAAGREWLKAQTGARAIPDDWMKLDWDGFRIAWRDIARNDDRRTLISSIVPPQVGLSDTAPFIRPFELGISPGGLEWKPQYSFSELLYLAGMLSSFACDSVVRTRVSRKHLTKTTFQGLHIPEWHDSPNQRRVAELTARLTCLPADDTRPWADYTDLAAAVDLTPESDALTDPQDRHEAEVELNALACQIYGLQPDAFRFLMNELFMTPQHKERHGRMRDEISARI